MSTCIIERMTTTYQQFVKAGMKKLKNRDLTPQQKMSLGPRSRSSEYVYVKKLGIRTVDVKKALEQNGILNLRAPLWAVSSS